MAYSKKYTNADFYKDGKFLQDVAMEAMKDMFAYYGVPFTELMAKEMWVTDFGLGDFENVGMGGIFWVNDPEYSYPDGVINVTGIAEASGDLEEGVEAVSPSCNSGI